MRRWYNQRGLFVSPYLRTLSMQRPLQSLCFALLQGALIWLCFSLQHFPWSKHEQMLLLCKRSAVNQPWQFPTTQDIFRVLVGKITLAANYENLLNGMNCTNNASLKGQLSSSYWRLLKRRCIEWTLSLSNFGQFQKWGSKIIGQVFTSSITCSNGKEIYQKLWCRCRDCCSAPE